MNPHCASCGNGHPHLRLIECRGCGKDTCDECRQGAYCEACGSDIQVPVDEYVDFMLSEERYRDACAEEERFREAVEYEPDDYDDA